MFSLICPLKQVALCCLSVTLELEWQENLKGEGLNYSWVQCTQHEEVWEGSGEEEMMRNGRERLIKSDISI